MTTFVIAASTRQFLDWCRQEAEDPKAVTPIIDTKSARGIHPEPTDTVVFLDIPHGWDKAERNHYLTVFGVKD